MAGRVRAKPQGAPAAHLGGPRGSLASLLAAMPAAMLAPLPLAQRTGAGLVSRTNRSSLLATSVRKKQFAEAARMGRASLAARRRGEVV